MLRHTHCSPQVQRAIAGLDLPNNPLDELIDRLGGPARVAEMTGRKGRLVRRKDGEAGVKWEARNASGVDKGSSLEMINILERKMFLSGEKLVAVISEAASAGISLHADRSPAPPASSSCPCTDGSDVQELLAQSLLQLLVSCFPGGCWGLCNFIRHRAC